MAVYTEVSDDDMAAFVASYGLGRLHSYKGIAEGVENTNYLVVTDRGNFILTVYEKRVNVEDLPFFLGLMEHLGHRGLTCPSPVRNAEGKALGELAGKPAAIVTFLEGVWIRRPRVEHCAAVGAALARMHLAGQDFALRRENALGWRGWRPLFDRFAPRADEVSKGLGSLIASELDHLEASWPNSLPAGVIHADLFPDNVFFLNDELSGLIDFYFACNDALAYDVAVCLNAWCFEPDHAFNVTKGRALLRGYLGVRALLPDERAALPMLCRGAALRFLLTRAFDWINTPAGALVNRKDPMEYVRKLRFHQGLKHAGELGLDLADGAG
ncbi:MAG TPA: homoserine kinase [Hyphomicrobiaceae bacterium]|nr:homoserine kinase [Hyphomicrobiaceae bacterium]